MVGAEEFRNPEQDLQPDFVTHRREHYADLAKPLDAREFLDAVRGEHEDVFLERLLLCIHGYGTNTGIRGSPQPARTGTANTTCTTSCAST